MNLIQRMSPAYSPASIAQKGDQIVLKERALQTILFIVCLIGIPSVSLAVYDEVAKANFVLAGIYLGFYFLFLILLIARNLPYGFRGSIIVAVAYFLAVSELFSSGQLGEVRMFLIAYVALTSVFFSYRVVIFAILLSVLSIILPGLYVASNPDPVVLSLASINQANGWLTSSVVFLMIASVVAGSISMIITGLQKNLLKQAELAQSLETERATLEERIQERTRSVAKRMVQLRTAAEISRAISALSDPDALLAQVVDVIKNRFDLYYVGVFLVESGNKYAVLKAGTGEAGKNMLREGHRLSIGGNSMISWAISNRRSRIALDVGMEEVRFINPHLPATRSEIALPIIAHSEVLGALTIQSAQPNAYDEHDIAILESVADSLAIALENNRLYQETRQSLDEIRALNREYLQRVWADTVENYGDLSYQYENPMTEKMSGDCEPFQVPLVLRDEVIGYIDLDLDQSELTEDERTFIDNVTTQTAIALENARLLQETERRAIQEQKLNELASRFSKALSIDEILRTAVQEFGQLPTVTEVSVKLNPAGNFIKTGITSSWDSGRNGREHSK